jgi:hypothetical protein
MEQRGRVEGDDVELKLHHLEWNPQNETSLPSRRKIKAVPWFIGSLGGVLEWSGKV